MKCLKCVKELSKEHFEIRADTKLHKLNSNEYQGLSESLNWLRKELGYGNNLKG